MGKNNLVNDNKINGTNKRIDPLLVKDNVINEFKNNLALVTAKKKDGSFNFCTVAWGSIGELWSKNVVTIYIKPIRYTSIFLNEDQYFSVTFMPNSYQKDVLYCGSHSGRDVNKIENTSLKPIILNNAITFENYRRVYICRKIYQDQFKLDNILDNDIIKKYYQPEQPHNIYIGEIIEVYEQ